MFKASKQSVDYSRGHAGAHCGKVLDDDKAPGFDELKNKVELPGAILRWAVAKLGRRGRRREGGRHRQARLRSIYRPRCILATPDRSPAIERGLIESDARVQRKSKAKGFLSGCALGPL